MYIGKTLIKTPQGMKDIMTVWISRYQTMPVKIGQEEIKIRALIHPLKATRQFCNLYHRPKVSMFSPSKQRLKHNTR